MAKNKVICTTNNVEYIQIRKAMIQGARTVEEVQNIVSVCNECNGCKENLDYILSSVCGCGKTSLKAVIDAVKNGANTVEKVGVATGAGTGEDCGRCHGLIQNIIDLGR